MNIRRKKSEAEEMMHHSRKGPRFTAGEDCIVKRPQQIIGKIIIFYIGRAGK